MRDREYKGTTITTRREDVVFQTIKEIQEKTELDLALEEVQQKINQLDLSSILEKDKQKVRGRLSKMQKEIANKFKDTTETEFDFDVAQKYINDLLMWCLEGTEEPKLPFVLEGKAKSKAPKELISRSIDQHKESFCLDIPLLKLIFRKVQYSNNLEVFKSNLKLYREAVLLHLMNLELQYMIEEVDQENKAIKEQNEIYKHENRLAFMSFTKDDAKVDLAIKAHRLLREGKSEREIAKELKVNKSTVHRVLKDFEYESIRDLSDLPEDERIKVVQKLNQNRVSEGTSV